MLPILAALLAVAWAPVGDADIHVATTGSDVTGNGTASSPYATPAHAAAVVHALGLDISMTSDQVILLEPGTYGPLALTDANSGSGGHYIVYRCNGSPGACVLDGGATVDHTTCVLYSGSVYRCTVPGSASFYTLWRNGARAPLARTPNVVTNAIWSDAQAPYIFAESSGGTSHTVLEYKSADLDLTGMTASDLSLVSMSMFPGFPESDWYQEIVPVSSFNPTTRQVTLAHELRFYAFSDGAGARYFAQGDLSMVDAAGEWYLDRGDVHGAAPGGKHYLYVYGDPTSDTIVYPTTQDVLSISGSSSASLATHIKFDGLEVTHSDFAPWFRASNAWGADQPAGPYPPGTSTGPDWQTGAGAGHDVTPFASVETPPVMRHGLVSMSNADSIIITNSHLDRGGFGCAYHYVKATNVTYSNDWIEQCGYDGIQFEGGYPREGQNNTGHTLSNVMVERAGQLAAGASLVDVLNAGNITASRMTLRRSNRAGIIVYSVCTSDSCYATGSTFTGVKIDTTAEDSYDIGSIYTSGIFNTANTFNQITMNRSFGAPNGRGAPVVCAYADLGSLTQTWTNINATHCSTTSDTYVGSQPQIWGNVSYGGSGATCTAGQTFNSNTTGCTYTDALVDYQHIGVDRASFPFTAAADAANAWTDNFENGLSGWTAGLGTPHLSTTQAHSATHSFVVDADGVVIYKILPTSLNQTGTVWFYDDTTQTNMESCARFDQIDLVTGTSGVWDTNASRGICASKSHSAGFYSTWINNAFAATAVARATGWHAFSWDFRDGVHAMLLVDSVPVAIVTGLREFNVVSIGDYAADGKTGTSYFDDAAVN